MFSGPKNNQATPKQSKRQEVSRDAAVTILTSGCHFSGKLYCRGSTRIGGRIEGEIASEGLLIIEEEAQIEANIMADEVVIQGRAEGKLEASGRVELCASSSFSGDVITPVLVIKEGAQFNGRSSMAAPARDRRTVGEYETPKLAEDLNFKVETKEVAFHKMPEITT